MATVNIHQEVVEVGIRTPSSVNVHQTVVEVAMRIPSTMQVHQTVIEVAYKASVITSGYYMLAPVIS